MLYEAPTVNILLLAEEDILTTSDQMSSTPDLKDENVRDDGWL